MAPLNNVYMDFHEMLIQRLAERPFPHKARPKLTWGIKMYKKEDILPLSWDFMMMGFRGRSVHMSKVYQNFTFFLLDKNRNKINGLNIIAKLSLLIFLSTV